MADQGDDVPLPKNFGFSQGKIPSPEDLLAAVEKMAGLSDENKEELKQSILRGAASRMAADYEGAAAAAVGDDVAPKLVLLLILISLVFSVIVFFGYKLYNSLVERERRKEEKRRQKQQKKKK